jgi:sugar phosphate isomerase/epimerase
MLKFCQKKKFFSKGIIYTMYLAISTACLYPLQTEIALQILLEQEFKNFEVFVNSESELSNEYIETLKNKLNKYNASIYSVHLFTSGFEPLMFFSNYSRRLYDSIEQYKRYFAAAKKLGALVVVFHGDRIEGALGVEEYCERFSLLTRAAKEEGVIIAQENVSRCKSRSLEFIKSMRKLGGDGNFKFVLDLKQTIRAQTNPFEMLEAMGTDVINVHISDSTAENDCLLPGYGDFDFTKLYNSLNEINYNGPLVIEVYRHNFNELTEINESFKYTNKLFL